MPPIQPTSITLSRSFFFIKININQIDKKLRLSLMMSTCYLGALSDLVENIFFSRGAFNKTKNFTKLFGEFYFVCLSVVFCFYIQRGRNQIIVYPKTYWNRPQHKITHTNMCTHTRIRHSPPNYLKKRLSQCSLPWKDVWVF